jgi:hypothetical protein
MHENGPIIRTLENPLEKGGGGEELKAALLNYIYNCCCVYT